VIVAIADDGFRLTGAVLLNMPNNVAGLTTAGMDDPVRCSGNGLVVMMAQIAIVPVTAMTPPVFMHHGLVVSMPHTMPGGGHSGFVVRRHTGAGGLRPSGTLVHKVRRSAARKYRIPRRTVDGASHRQEFATLAHMIPFAAGIRLRGADTGDDGYRENEA